jgi:hypothetical protein
MVLNVITLKKLKFLFIGVIISLFLNLFYFKFLIKEDYFKIITRIASFNYLSFEPYIVRGKFVKDFDINCVSKYECLPFKKNNFDRIIFIKKVSNFFDKDPNSLIFISLYLVDDILSDIRFYIKNPIYIDTKVLGISYFANENFFTKYKNRFNVAYNYHECRNVDEIRLYNNKGKYLDRKKYLDDLYAIFNTRSNCKNFTLQSIKQEKIKYVIDKKENLNDLIKVICHNDLCLAKL